MRPKKALGQNFLQDGVVAARIVDSLEAAPGDLVIEIGPGRGALTELLIEREFRVAAVEFDRDLVPLLTERFSRFDNFSLISGDALHVDFAELARGSATGRAKLVANLPYNISTPILQRLVDQRGSLESMVLMFQREVVDRITARPGSRDRGYLSVLVDNAFTAERLFDVAPASFRPVPKVWSSVVRFVPHASFVEGETLFREIVSIAFTHKRKTLLNNLAPSFNRAEESLRNAGIEPGRRAETLDIDEWGALTAEVKNAGHRICTRHR
jgi:16S rRNA (adenine1518-N6/adenine1519-N6)-dimethyltransferase